MNHIISNNNSQTEHEIPYIMDLSYMDPFSLRDYLSYMDLILFTCLPLLYGHIYPWHGLDLTYMLDINVWIL